MLVDVLGVDVAVRVGRVVAVVDRRPHRAVRCDGEAGAVADARRERLGRAAARRDPHDRRARGIGVAVLGGDVARRTDREVHRTVGSDGDALQRMRVGAVQFGAARIGKPGGHGPPIGGRAVGVVVRVDLVALGDVQRRTRERHPVRLVETVEQRRLLRRRTGFRRQLHDLSAGGHRYQQRAVRCPRLQPRLRDPRPHRHRPAVGHQRLPWLVERRLSQVAGNVDGRGHQIRGPRRRCGRRRRRRGAGDCCGGDSVEHPASTAMPTSPTTNPLRGGQIRMHLPDQDLGRLGCGHALAARAGEPDGVAFAQTARRLRASPRRAARTGAGTARRAARRRRPAAAARRAVRRSCCGW